MHPQLARSQPDELLQQSHFADFFPFPSQHLPQHLATAAGSFQSLAGLIDFRHDVFDPAKAILLTGVKEAASGAVAAIAKAEKAAAALALTISLFQMIEAKLG